MQDIHEPTGLIAVGGYSSDVEVVPDSVITDPTTAYQKPIIFLIDRMNQFRWRLCLRDFSENVMSLKFSSDGTFIVAVMENNPLTLIFIKTADGLLLGSQRHSLPGGYTQDPRPCVGDCLAFSPNSNSFYLSLQSIYLATMEATYSPY